MMQKLKTPLKYTAILLAATLGRYPVSWLLSRKRGKALHWPQPGTHHWVKCASGNEYYVEFDGPLHAQPLVFIHGLNATREQWYYQRKFFKEQFRLVFIDLPGHGQSKAANNLSIDILAADLKRVLGFLHIHNPIIYGHSWGSAILMQCCLNKENGVNAKGVILHGGAYTNPLKNVEYSKLATFLEKPVIVPLLKLMHKVSPVLDVLRWVNYSSGLTSVVARFAFFAGMQTTAQLLFTASLATHCKTQAVTGGLLQMLQHEVTAKLKDIDIPVLVIGSQHDRLHRYDCSWYIHKHIPQSRWAAVDGGHQSLIENHKLLNQAIAQFIQTL
ncbi:alpha/beta hydrolase [Mucilaginibacter sp. Bleaf8]|uniref:alpha/beta fold hydrolase n=1 Tax=Mucilaginibacter sp. Bleaf8 TaxID=2834430 RepID=UPI001BCEC733|nr:alpha/beta hydrolase [Mucilaginibacter sp. Bleaf8]MBS7563901.1 alpha/beta hydrolase [Mucilaginibacter sp. Bleaf8]